jgi:hypothetical protein
VFGKSVTNRGLDIFRIERIESPDKMVERQRRRGRRSDQLVEKDASIAIIQIARQIVRQMLATQQPVTALAGCLAVCVKEGRFNRRSGQQNGQPGDLIAEPPLGRHFPCDPVTVTAQAVANIERVPRLIVFGASIRETTAKLQHDRELGRFVDRRVGPGPGYPHRHGAKTHRTRRLSFGFAINR